MFFGETYHSLQAKVEKATVLYITPFFVEDFIKSNPEFYYTYWLLGDYYKFNRKDFGSALKYYEIALTKEIPRDNEEEYLKKAILECKAKMQQK